MPRSGPLCAIPKLHWSFGSYWLLHNSMPVKEQTFFEVKTGICICRLVAISVINELQILIVFCVGFQIRHNPKQSPRRKFSISQGPIAVAKSVAHAQHFLQKNNSVLHGSDDSISLSSLIRFKISIKL